MKPIRVRVYSMSHGEAIIKQLVELGCIDKGKRNDNPRLMANWTNVTGIYASGKSITFVHWPFNINRPEYKEVTLDDLYRMANKPILIKGKEYSEETIHNALKAYVGVDQ